MKKLTNRNLAVKVTLACALAGWMCWTAGNCNAQTPPANPPPLPPELQEVVTLSREHMSDDVITAYVRNSGKSYTLSADQIIYLNSQGVSQHVISTLLETPPAPSVSAQPQPPPAPTPGPAPTPMQAPQPPVAAMPQPGAPPPPAETPPLTPPEGVPAADVNYDYFHAQLAPFGTWVQVSGYGWCWRPDAAIVANPNWRPYYDMGQWVYTDNGWFWQSDYTWGDIPFHYGNWVLDPAVGWVWVPGYVWGPSWVFWRHAEVDACIGWAPLPPGAVFVDGGWIFNGVHVGVDFDFGLGANFFVFVGYDHFHDGFFRMRGHEYAFHEPRERVDVFYHRSVLRNDFRQDERGRLINDGIGRDRVERLTHRREVPERFQERNPVGDRERLAAQRGAEVHRESGPRDERAPAPERERMGRPSTHEPVSKVYRPPAESRGFRGEPKGGSNEPRGGGSKKRGGD